MYYRRSIVIAFGFAVALLSSVSFAGHKLMRPVSVQEGRYHALQAAGIPNIWRGDHHVNLMGFTRGGKTLVMVKSADLQKPVIVSLQATRGEYGREIQASALDDKGLRRLGLVTPSKALSIALESAGLFKGVTGETKLVGASRKGLAYKFIVTPAAPVTVKSPYGVFTVEELTRVVNALGQGESAYPTPGKYKFVYGLGGTHTRPAIGSAAE